MIDRNLLAQTPRQLTVIYGFTIGANVYPGEEIVVFAIDTQDDAGLHFEKTATLAQQARKLVFEPKLGIGGDVMYRPQGSLAAAQGGVDVGQFGSAFRDSLLEFLLVPRE